MSDEEIIEALELCCTQDGSIPCYDCPCWDDGVQKCEGLNYADVLGLINRQKAEIKKLKSKNKILSRNADNAFQEGLNERRELFEPEIKSEAYKEFAERIKMSIKASVVETLCNDVKGIYNAEYVLDDIDTLLKEMVGEGND